MFWNKKKYVMNLFAICDFSKKFTYIYTSWSNLQHDSRVFKSIHIFKHLDEYFLENQYLLNDSIYLTMSQIITSYIAFKRKISKNARFNKLLFNIRIDIKHVFDMLKKRWINLTNLRLTLRNRKQYMYVCQWIVVCTILHNILLKLNDTWKKKNDWWNENEKKNMIKNWKNSTTFKENWV